MSDDKQKYTPIMDNSFKIGRPTDYSDKILDDAYKYLIQGWKEVGEAIPSIVGLALWLGVTKKTVYNWQKDEEKADFLHICDAINNMQENCLINNGVTGAFSAPITKMILTKHGYSDKVENVNTNTGTKTVYIEKADKASMEDHIEDITED